MARKATSIDGVGLDWDARDETGVINQRAQTEGEWEAGVVEALKALYIQQPCVSSRAVLDELAAAAREKGKTVTIIPFVLEPHKTAMGRIPAALNAGAVADDKPAATVRGKLSDELPDSVIQQIAAMPPGPARDQFIDSLRGTALGSSSRLYFTAQDWAPISQNAGLDAADETLLHELVHSLRQLRGLEDPDRLLAPFAVQRGGEKGPSGSPTPQTQHSQVYDTGEEFAAIVITNIYRSENDRSGLRRDHLADANNKDPPLVPPLTNARNFLTAWRPQLEKMQGEMPLLCAKLAAVECHFNPLFELYATQNRFAPGTRRVLAKAWADPR